MIDSRAIVDPKAKIGKNVIIGPWTLIGPDVEIGEGTEIGAHVIIEGITKIGKENKIHSFVSLGSPPQVKSYQNEPTRLEIGDRNIFREYASAHRGTPNGKQVTRIGNENYFMVASHVAHDCLVGNEVNFANNASIAGHVIVEDYANLGGFVGIHQYCKVGAYSFLAGGSVILKDVPPFVMVSGFPAETHGLNVVGLERRGFTAATITALKRAYKIIFRKNYTIQVAVAELKTMITETAEVKLLVDFLDQSTRGIVR